MQGKKREDMTGGGGGEVGKLAFEVYILRFTYLG